MGNSESQNLESFNILVIGRKCVGKSTLINCIFGEKLAEEGNGVPCTKKIQAYTKKDSHLTLYDTPSLRICSTSYFENFKKLILDLITEQSKTKDNNKLIHCIWYCIDSNEEIIYEPELQIISTFKNIPVIVVLTKSDNREKTNEMMRKIENLPLKIQHVVPVLARETKMKKAYGVDILINFSISLLPDKMKIAFDNIEFQNLNRINVITVGQTGVGKSTLINAVLGKYYAEEDDGKPVTLDITEYSDNDSIFSMVDVPGFELDPDQQKQVQNKIFQKIEDKSKVGENIHCIWYCIRFGSSRIQKAEIDFINNISSSAKKYRIPVILVLTQCYYQDDEQKMIQSIKDSDANIFEICPVISKDKEFVMNDDEQVEVIKAFGVETLKKFTYQAAKYKYNKYDITKLFGDNIDEQIKNLQKTNIVLVGEERSGKTTLINKIFDAKIAKTIYEDPDEIHEYEKADNVYIFFHVFYTPIVEDDFVLQVKLHEKIFQLIDNRINAKDPNKIVHCVWYCIKCGSDVINESKIQFIKNLHNELGKYKIPLIFVLTQCYDENKKDEMIHFIETKFEEIKYIQPIVAEKYINNDPLINIEPFGIEELKEKTNVAMIESYLPQNIYSQVAKCYNNVMNNLNKLNIITIGKTGVGKSTLINNFFRGHLASTGVGVPVTQNITALTIPNSRLTIYDTPGLELNKDQQTDLKKRITKMIQDGYKSNDINKYIHCIWYCINCDSARFEDSEKRFIQELTEVTSRFQVPVLVVLTQAYDRQLTRKMKAVIESENMKIIQVIPVVAEGKKIGKSICNSYGLDVLTEVMGNQLPDNLKITFNNVQVASLSYKRKCAGAVITSFSISSAAVGASPIPFSDCFLLVGIEAAMITSITAIYNIQVGHGFVSDFLGCLFGCSAATFIGRAVVANLVKCIPVIGSIVGAVFGGITGFVMTGAIGGTYILIIEAILRGEFDPKSISKAELKEKITPIFSDMLTIFKKKKEENKNGKESEIVNEVLNEVINKEKETK